MKKSIFLISVLLFVSFVYGYEVTVETQLIYDNNGTAKIGTFNDCNFTIINSTNDIIFTNVSNITTDKTGRFHKIFHLDYFGNESLRAKWNCSGENQDYTIIGFVPYAINSQFLQGKNLTYFNIYNDTYLVLSLENWSADRINYVNLTVLDNDTIIRVQNTSWITDNQNYWNNTDVEFNRVNATNLTINEDSFFNRIGSWGRKVTSGFFSFLHSDTINSTTTNATKFYKDGEVINSTTELNDIYIKNNSDAILNDLELTGDLNMNDNEIKGTGYIQNTSLWNVSHSGTKITWTIRLK